MPFNHQAMRRRRILLNISQHTLGIMAGIHPNTIGKIERGTLPEDGGKLGIDVFMRICEALQMDYTELLTPPSGNRYERAVAFARAQQSPLAAPHLHDQSRTIQARGLRKLGREIETPTLPREEIHIHEEPEGDVDGYDGEATSFDFMPDPSTE